MKKEIIINPITLNTKYFLTADSIFLKESLLKRGVSTSICYWDFILLELQTAFIWSKSEINSTISDKCLLLFNYLAVRGKNKELYSWVRIKLMAKRPSLYWDRSVYDKQMEHFADLFEEQIDEIIKKNEHITNPHWVFVVQTMEQELYASVISKRIKIENSKSVISICRNSNSRWAKSALKQSPYFDFAIWKFIPDPIVLLANNINNNVDYDKIPYLSYRNDDEILLSRCKNTTKQIYNTFEFSITDISDLSKYNQLNDEQKDNYCLNIDLQKNLGIIKSLKNLDLIFKSFIFKFKSTLFHLYIDGTSNHLSLIKILSNLKVKYTDYSFAISNAPNIQLTPKIIAAFYKLGCSSINVSYSIVDKGKALSFASLLLYIKYASKYQLLAHDISLYITGLESFEDVSILTNNLYCLRHFISGGVYYHKLLYNEENKYKNFYKEKKHIIEYVHANINKNTVSVWNEFIECEKYLKQNKFDYRLYKLSEDRIIYKEICNSQITKEIELDDVDLMILKEANKKVTNITNLKSIIIEKHNKKFIDIEFINILENLLSEGLIYESNGYDEIISIIDTESIISIK